MKLIFAVVFAVLVAFGATVLTVTAVPPQQEAQENAEALMALGNHLLQRARMSMIQLNGARDYPFIPQNKRNSELINSILGLPKVMTDAGRRK